MDTSQMSALEVIHKHGLEKRFANDLLDKTKYARAIDQCSPEYVYVFTDGSTKSGKSGCGCVIHMPDRVIKTNIGIQKLFQPNLVEYEAILFAVLQLKGLNISDTKALFFTDNQSLADQLSGRAKCRSKRVRFYVVNILCTLYAFNIEAVFSYTPRSSNNDAHLLAKKARIELG